MNTMIKSINILIPTYKRSEALAVTLTSLYYQSEKNFDIIIADQSPGNEIEKDNSIQTISINIKSILIFLLPIKLHGWGVA
jgi:GT2 family glycosyltransferase